MQHFKKCDKGYIEFNKMKPREGEWIEQNSQKVNEKRFASNLHKIPRICTKVKRGELLDLNGNDNTVDMSQMKSRNECLIIGNDKLMKT